MNSDICVVLRFARHFRNVNSSNLLSSSYSHLGNDLPMCSSSKDLGVTVETDLKFHSHIKTAVSKASGLSINMLRSTVCRKPDFMMALYKSHIRPLFEFCSCVWYTGYVGDNALLEKIQRRWTKEIDGLGDLPYSIGRSLTDFV